MDAQSHLASALQLRGRPAAGSATAHAMAAACNAGHSTTPSSLTHVWRMHRNLAEQPLAWPERVQQLLPALLNMHAYVSSHFFARLRQQQHLLQLGWALASECCHACRYLADQPLAWPERVQRLLPALLSMQEQAACPFLLPLLTQLADPLELAALQADSDASGSLGWPEALRQNEVCPVLPLLLWLLCIR